MKLVIGNKNYSSWSLRAWILLKKSGLDFEEHRIPLFVDNFQEALDAHSPAGLVPILIDDDLTVWDSLAIAEYIAEKVPSLWPVDIRTRAIARSASAEMHSGFSTIRTKMPMNCRALDRSIPIEKDLSAEIDRIKAIWESSRALTEEASGNNGPWLFGEFSIADAMFAPVVLRFRTFQIRCNGRAAEYVDTVLNDPDIKLWCEVAGREAETIQRAEVGL